MTILDAQMIKLHEKVSDKEEAIRMVGQMLVEAGHVPEPYVDAMLERERVSSTYMGAGLAIPHGTNEAKSMIRSTGLAILIVPDGVEFGTGERAQLIVGIAAAGDEHMDLLTQIAMIASDQDLFRQLIQADTADEVLAVLSNGVEG